MGPSFTIVNHKHNYANVNLKFYPVRIKFNLNFKNNVNKTNEKAYANRKYDIFSLTYILVYW